MRRKAALAQWSNPEIKAKILKENNGMYGKHHTAEAKKKISEKRMGKPSPHRNTTPVLCVELNKTFQDAVTACEKLGLKRLVQVVFFKFVVMNEKLAVVFIGNLSENNIS